MPQRTFEELTRAYHEAEVEYYQVVGSGEPDEMGTRFSLALATALDGRKLGLSDEIRAWFYEAELMTIELRRAATETARRKTGGGVIP